MLSLINIVIKRNWTRYSVELQGSIRDLFLKKPYKCLTPFISQSLKQVLIIIKYGAIFEIVFDVQKNDYAYYCWNSISSLLYSMSLSLGISFICHKRIIEQVSFFKTPTHIEGTALAISAYQIFWRWQECLLTRFSNSKGLIYSTKSGCVSEDWPVSMAGSPDGQGLRSV